MAGRDHVALLRLAQTCGHGPGRSQVPPRQAVGVPQGWGLFSLPHHTSWLSRCPSQGLGRDESSWLCIVPAVLTALQSVPRHLHTLHLYLVPSLTHLGLFPAVRMR